MKIAVWGPTPFAGRKTVNLLLLSLQALREEGKEQLILHADPAGSGPEHFLLSGGHRTRMMKKKEFGLELLCKMMRCERVTKEMIVEASYSFAEGKLHVLPAGHKEFYEDSTAVKKELHNVLHWADKFFSNVWIELPAGDSSLVREILSQVDCVIVNFAQSPCEIAKLEPALSASHVFYVVGAYEQRNIYTLHNLQLLYPFLRGKCGGVPYYTALAAACCSGEAEAVMQKEEEKEMKFPTLFSELMKTYMKEKKGECADDPTIKETGRKGETTEN